MSNLYRSGYKSPQPLPERLHNGDHLNQPEFHALYEQMPANYKAELLDGTVFVSEALGLDHGSNDANLTGLFWLYARATPGVKTHHNTTIILGADDEVQPDLVLRLLPEFGGRTKTISTGVTSYASGMPELVAEVAHSSRSIDLHIKKKRYSKHNGIEYLVLCLEPAGVYWFDLSDRSEIKADPEGIYRSKVFPGLWLDSPALLSDDVDALIETLNRGLESAEHKEFIDGLRSLPGGSHN